MQELNRRIVLERRPPGVPKPQDFRRDDRAVESLNEGEFLVRNLYVSVDPRSADGSTPVATIPRRWL
jgi:NADPH-dependent curcumin reductase CurA